MTEDLRSAIEKHAKRIGANPADFATIISYETGGTFDPWKKGPTTKWGTHIGFIQMGDPQRKEFGYTEGKSVDELIGASADYLVANGYKPGMGLMDMYSTVNAGAPGRFNRSDYGNGGAPGTVADKVNYQMEGHKRKAVALLGGTYVPNITTPQDPVAWKEGAGTGNRQGYEFYKMGLPDSSGYRYTVGVGDPGGTYSSLPSDAQSADTDYDGGLYPVDVTRRDQWVMDMNAKSQRGLPVNDVSYGDTYDAAYNKSWFGNQVDRLVKNWSFQNDPDWDREKELPKVLEKYPTDYWHRFSGVSSAEHAQWVEDQVSKEMQWDAKLQANGWTGFGSQMLFEMVNPLMLLGGVGAELTAAKMLGGAWKATRVARMGRSALLAGTGNVGSEMAMSLVDQQRRTSQDYALAFGAGAVLGGTFGIFTKGTSPVDLRINKEMQQLGKAIMQGQGNAGAAMSPATTMVENLPGGELKVEWGDMDAAREASFGRKLSNLISSVPGIRQLSNPMTKAEFLGSGPFNIVRSIIPDPRGVRSGEVLRETVGDRYQMFVDAQHRDWKIMAEPQFNKWAKRTLQGSDGMLNRMGLNDTPREKFFAQVVDYIENEDELTRVSFDPEVASVAEHAIKMYERIGKEAYDRGLFKDIIIQNPPKEEVYYEDVPFEETVTQDVDSGIRSYSGNVEAFHGFSDRPRLDKRPYTESEKQAALDKYTKWYNADPERSFRYQQPPKDIAEAEALEWFVDGIEPPDTNWKKTFRTGTSSEDSGRYDGSVFGDNDTVYLDGDGKWIGGRVERFSVEEAVRVASNFKDALVIEPDNYEKLFETIYKSEKSISGKSIADWAKKNGHDGIIVNGFDGMLSDLEKIDASLTKKYGESSDIFQDQIAVFNPRSLKVGDAVGVGPNAPTGNVADQIKGRIKSKTTKVTSTTTKTKKVERTRQVQQEPTIIKWEPNRFYNPYYKDDAKFLEINDKFGDLDVKEAVRKAFKEDFAEASDDLIAKLTDGYLNRLTKATLGIEDTARVAFSSADKAQIMAWLRDEVGITDQSLIDEFMNLPKFRGGDAGPRFKRRSFSLKAYNTKVKMRYREGYSGPRKNVTADNPDGWEEFSIRDFFVKNADDQMERYVREMSGALAFADLKITDPKTGELMVDGVKNDADWMKVKNLIQTLAVADNPRNAEAARDLVEELDYIYNALRKNGGDNPRMSKIGRRLNQTMFNVYMNNLGINSAQELSNTIATTSFYHAIKGVKPIKRMLDEAGKSVPIVPMIRDLEALVGVGHKRLLGSEHYVARMNRAGIENVSSKVGRGFDVVNGKVQAGVMKASGFEYIDNSLQVGAVNAMANTFVDMAQKYSKELEGGRFKMTDIDTIFAKDSRRLRSLGLDDKRLVGILNEIRKNYRVTDDGPDIQMDKWDNENASALRLALHRYYRRAIQQNDVGALSRWLQHPVAKVLLAFRSFIMVGMDKQFGYGLGHFDGRQAYQWLLNMTLAGSIWYLYQKATSLGQKDPKAYMERKFGEEGSYEFYRNLAIAGATRSGFTTVFPALYDTAAYFADLPRIDTRTSGQATAAWGAPFMSWLDTAARASSAAIKSVKEDRELSRQEINYIARTFNNNFLFIGLLNKATQDRAEFAPRNN